MKKAKQITLIVLAFFGSAHAQTQKPSLQTIMNSFPGINLSGLEESIVILDDQESEILLEFIHTAYSEYGKASNEIVLQNGASRVYKPERGLERIIWNGNRYSVSVAENSVSDVTVMYCKKTGIENAYPMQSVIFCYSNINKAGYLLSRKFTAPTRFVLEVNNEVVRQLLSESMKALKCSFEK